MLWEVWNSNDFALPFYVKVQALHLIMLLEVQKMNEKKNKHQRRLDFQQKMISRQSEQIDSLKKEIEKLNLKLKEKDEIINSVVPLKEELTKNVNEVKEYKKTYIKLVEDLRKMKSIMNQEVYKGRWWLVKFLIK